MGALIRAIDKMGIPKDDIVLASGIGCSAEENAPRSGL
jgi:hypothetical protein